jgi:hypothetical protein
VQRSQSLLNDPFPLLGIVVGAMLTVGFLWAARRANELFAIRVVRGTALHIRGRVPPALFSAIAEVVARPPIERATLRAVLRGRVPTLEVGGNVPDYQIQQLRNVLGQFPAARIRSGRVASRAAARLRPTR